MPDASAPRDSLAAMLRVDAAGAGRYHAALESFWGASLSGDLLARALLAASAEAGALPAALQASFFRAPAPGVELSLATSEPAPGRWRVAVQQEGAPVAEVMARVGPGPGAWSYQGATPEPDLPAPETLPSEAEQAAAEGWAEFAVGPVESRRIGDPKPVASHEPALWQGWLRPREALPDDARLHAAALAFASEYRSHWAVERRLGPAFPESEITLLDHALWIHRHVPWDDWWLVRTRSDVGAAGRSLSQREIFTRDGTLVASAAWEAWVRVGAEA
jgi:acyl-CoA thioesterase II